MRRETAVIASLCFGLLSCSGSGSGGGGPVAPAIATFVATPSTVVAGASTEIAWAWSFAAEPTPAPTCTIDRGVGAVAEGSASIVTLSSAATFTLTCTNAAGSDSARATVSVVAPVPPRIATLSATPSSVTEGVSTVVTWTWTYAGTPIPTPVCEIDGGVGAVASGDSTAITLSATTTFTLTCHNGTGSDSTATVIVAAPEPRAPALATFQPSPATVARNAATTITWSWTYASPPSPAPTCVIDQGVGPVTSGSSTSISLATETVFTLTCTNAAGSDSAVATIALLPDPVAPQIATFTTAPSVVPAGVPSDVVWSWTYASPPQPAATCHIDPAIGALGSGETAAVTLASATAFTLTCENSAGTATAATTLTTNPPRVAPSLATFSATPARVTVGVATPITWRWTFAAPPTPAPDCQISPGVGPVGSGWSAEQTLATETVFTLTCTNAGGTDSARTTVAASAPAQVIEVANGSDHTCVLLSGGHAQCFGRNFDGQLGNGTFRDSALPVDVVGLTSGVTAIAAGGSIISAPSGSVTSSHSCALVTGGGVKCWGANGRGQLGDGSTIGRASPVSVLGLSAGATAITAGDSQTCALMGSGSVKCWGEGVTSPADVAGIASATAISASGSTTCALISGGGVKCWTAGAAPADVTGLSGAMAIARGAGHACALVTGGGVKCWGSNYDGELGDGTNVDSPTPVDVLGLTSGVTAISAGGWRSCARLSSGELRCWGNNDHGEVGDGTRMSRNAPRTVRLTGAAAAVSTAGQHSCAVLQSGALWCWGSDEFGQLGDAATLTRLAPVAVAGVASAVSAVSGGGRHACALLATGAVQCWGFNGSGQLGDGSAESSASAVTVAGLGAGATAVSAGGYHTCARLTTGGIQCWGSNVSGRLGDGTNLDRASPVDVSGLSSGVLSVSAGAEHTCALLGGGGVKCWGSNTFGQLGDGTFVGRRAPTDVVDLTSGVVAISSGELHTCALLATGGVKCWGRNFSGQLGDGTGTDRSAPIDVSGLGSGVAAVSAGDNHSCALLESGGAMCWGANSSRELGDGTTTVRFVPVSVQQLAPATDVSAGKDFTCALVAGGLQCWGEGSSGQLGRDAAAGAGTPAPVSGLASGVSSFTLGGTSAEGTDLVGYACAVLQSGGVRCWGRDGDGEVSGSFSGIPHPVVSLGP